MPCRNLKFCEQFCRLHEKIIDVLTESLVALNDTIGSLEMKCDELAVPDNLDTADLVERHSSLEVSNGFRILCILLLDYLCYII